LPSSLQPRTPEGIEKQPEVSARKSTAHVGALFGTKMPENFSPYKRL